MRACISNPNQLLTNPIHKSHLIQSSSPHKSSSLSFKQPIELSLIPLPQTDFHSFSSKANKIPHVSSSTGIQPTHLLSRSTLLTLLKKGDLKLFPVSFCNVVST